MKTSIVRTYGMAVLAGLCLAAGCGGETPDNLTPSSPDGGTTGNGDGSPSELPDAADPSAPDAAPDTYVVRGTALGVIAPITLELAYTGGLEMLEVSGDGPFAFTDRLVDGSQYTVTVAGNAPCVLDGATGALSGADASNLRVTCDGVAALANLTVSGLVPPTIDVTPAQLAYTADLSLLQQTTTVTATVANPQATMELAGMPLASNTPSPVMTLALGANPIEIVVRHPAGVSRTYSLTVNRAPSVAQYVYGKASNTMASDLFGTSIALWGDTLAVGAYGEDSAATGIGGNQADESAQDSGAVYVFRRTGVQWRQEAYIKASNTSANDQFGRTIALWGNTLAVGAWQEDSMSRGINSDGANDGSQDSGAVYVFQRGQTGWQQEAYIKASNTGIDDRFGWSVALWDDTLAVGAYREDSDATGINGNEASSLGPDSGAVYVFRRMPAGWQQEAYIKASNTYYNDQFGYSVALRGNTLAVGAHLEDSTATGINNDETNDGALDSGAVYVFQRSQDGWQQEAYVKASNTNANDQFGASLALEDGVLAVGAVNEASAATGINGDQLSNTAPLSGAVYVYRRMATGWQQEAYVKASNTERGDVFGRSLALWGDQLAVGAYWESSAATGVGGNQASNTALRSGAVYLFRHGGAGWQQDAYIKASNTNGGDNFGVCVALGESTLVAGASGEASAGMGINPNLQLDNAAEDSGATYIFH